MSVMLSFLSVEDACKRLSISRSFFYLLVKRGELRPIKLGRRTLIPDSDLSQLLGSARAKLKPAPSQQVGDKNARPKTTAIIS